MSRWSIRGRSRRNKRGRRGKEGGGGREEQGRKGHGIRRWPTSSPLGHCIHSGILPYRAQERRREKPPVVCRCWHCRPPPSLPPASRSPRSPNSPPRGSPKRHTAPAITGTCMLLASRRKSSRFQLQTDRLEGDRRRVSEPVRPVSLALAVAASPASALGNEVTNNSQKRGDTQ